MNPLNSNLEKEESDLHDPKNTMIASFIIGINLYGIASFLLFDLIAKTIKTTLGYISYGEYNFFLFWGIFNISFYAIIFFTPIFIFFRSWVYYILGRQYMALLRDFIDRTADITTSVEHIDEILNISQTIHTLISKRHRFFYIFSHAGDKIKRWNNYLSYVITILSDLRSDLIYRLDEQREILEGAQSDLSRHVTGTAELDQVATLQRQRLDEQIKQFEEIQRVLV